MDDNRVSHNIIVEDRKHFILSGVKDVLNFDDETVMLDTSLGKLALKGEDLHILNFNNETGDLEGEGKIHALIYTSSEHSGGLFSKLLR